MVLGFVDTVLYAFSDPSRRYRESKLDNVLTAEGFSPSEAKDVAWIINYRAYGEALGLLGGAAICYSFNPQIKYACKR